MHRLSKDLVALMAYLFFGAVELLVVWAPFVILVLLPVGIAGMMGAKTGDHLSIGALIIGFALMGGWYVYLDDGAGKRIQLYFRKLTNSTIRKLGASDALQDHAE